MHNGHWFHFDHQKELKLVRTISHQDHIADMSLTDRWAPIVIAWSKNGRFMIAFDRKRKCPATDYVPARKENYSTENHSLGNSFHGQIQERAVTGSYAKIPVNYYPSVHASGGEFKLYYSRSNTPRSSCQGSRACKILRKLFRSDHHKSTVTMAGTAPELSFTNLEMGFGNAYFDSAPSEMLWELEGSAFHELPVQFQGPRELAAPQVFELPLTPFTPEHTNVPVQHPYQYSPQERNETKVSLQSQPAPPDYNLNSCNDLSMKAAQTPHDMSMPLQQSTRPKSEMFPSSAPPHVMLRRGVSLSVDVRSFGRYTQPMFQHHRQISPNLTGSTPGSDRSAESALFNDSWTPATPALSHGSDSTYPSATSPSHMELFGQNLSPGTPLHAELVQTAYDETFIHFNHESPTLEYQLTETQIPDSIKKNSGTVQSTHKTTKFCPSCGTPITGNPHDINCNMRRHQNYSCKKSKLKKRIRCGMDGCKKTFARTDGLRNHIAKFHARFFHHPKTASGSLASF